MTEKEFWTKVDSMKWYSSLIFFLTIVGGIIFYILTDFLIIRRLSAQVAGLWIRLFGLDDVAVSVLEMVLDFQFISLSNYALPLKVDKGSYRNVSLRGTSVQSRKILGEIESREITKHARLSFHGEYFQFIYKKTKAPLIKEDIKIITKHYGLKIEKTTLNKDFYQTRLSFLEQPSESLKSKKSKRDYLRKADEL
ncbi:MAG: hypothetical protein ACXQS8_09350 [Candidatus Helarchaeales archaeon]